MRPSIPLRPVRAPLLRIQTFNALRPDSFHVGEPKGLQKSTAESGQSAFERISAITRDMWRQEGFRAFYKGITPRVLRVAPGQAIVFAVYERVRKLMETMRGSSEENAYRE